MSDGSPASALLAERSFLLYQVVRFCSVIAVQGISKRYQLGANVRPQNNLREALGDAGVMVETVRGAGYRLTAQPQSA